MGLVLVVTGTEFGFVRVNIPYFGNIYLFLTLLGSVAKTFDYWRLTAA